MNWIISPTFDWTPNARFPVIGGAFHWAVCTGPKWRHVDDGFADTYEQAKEAIDQCIQASSSSSL